MTVVVDYGAGNLRSVLHALKHLGVPNVQLVCTAMDALPYGVHSASSYPELVPSALP